MVHPIRHKMVKERLGEEFDLPGSRCTEMKSSGHGRKCLLRRLSLVVLAFVLGFAVLSCAFVIGLGSALSYLFFCYFTVGNSYYRSENAVFIFIVSFSMSIMAYFVLDRRISLSERAFVVLVSKLGLRFGSGRCVERNSRPTTARQEKVSRKGSEAAGASEQASEAE